MLEESPLAPFNAPHLCILQSYHSPTLSLSHTPTLITFLIQQLPEKCCFRVHRGKHHILATNREALFQECVASWWTGGSSSLKSWVGQAAPPHSPSHSTMALLKGSPPDTPSRAAPTNQADQVSNAGTRRR